MLTREGKLPSEGVRALAELQVPPHDWDGLIRYVEDHIEPGGFLLAVLKNDLKDACAKADDINQRALFNIVNWLYNWAPEVCWGSPVRVEAWIESKIRWK